MASRIAVTVVLVALVGCSSSGTVTGTVFLDGKPLDRGTVTFHPVGSGPVAIGTIGPDGHYELAVGLERSVPPGDYVVTVVATEPAAEEPPPGNGLSKGPAVPRRITPERYGDKKTTDQKVTVRGGSNRIDLELTGGSGK